MPLDQHHKIEEKKKKKQTNKQTNREIKGGEKTKYKTGKSKGVTISPVPGINQPPFLAR